MLIPKQRIHRKFPELKRALHKRFKEGDLKPQLKFIDSEFGRMASPTNMLRHPDAVAICDATHDSRLNDQMEFLDAIRLAGFAPGYLDALRPRHFLAAVAILLELDLATATLRRKISAIRALYGWLEKSQSLPDNEDILPAHMQDVPTCATRDPTWTGRGLDPEALIAQVPPEYPWVRDAMRLMLHFGLRLSEALLLHPHDADRGRILIVDHKSKGTRERFVPVELPEQRALLDELKARYPRGQALCGAVGEITQAGARSKYYYRVRRILGVTRAELGVVTHGLRAEYLCKLYRRITGVRPPIQGGPPVPRRLDIFARQALAYCAGHGRRRVATAYVGAVLFGYRQKRGGPIREPVLSPELAFVMRHQDRLFETYAPWFQARKKERLARHAAAPRAKTCRKARRAPNSRLSALKRARAEINVVASRERRISHDR